MNLDVILHKRAFFWFIIWEMNEFAYPFDSFNDNIKWVEINPILFNVSNLFVRDKKMVCSDGGGVRLCLNLAQQQKSW